MDCMGKNTTKIYNIRAYLMAALFNAGSTIRSYYKAMVNFDMPQFVRYQISEFKHYFVTAEQYEWQM